MSNDRMRRAVLAVVAASATWATVVTAPLDYTDVFLG
jgi:hypothetical protein